MEMLQRLYAALPGMVLALCVVAAVVVALWAANWLLLHRNRNLGEEQRFPRRIAMALLVILGCAIVLLALPVGDDTRGQLLGLLGLLLSVAITLSSTTFLANAMAGLMLRAVGGFRSGDFIRVDEQFGRVTERGLFHTEIQTEDRDLTTLPNLYLVSNPVKVIRYSGTVVSATVSLGYDVPHNDVQSLLVAAARKAELQDPFVQVLELGDFSVTYRVAGLLTEVKQLMSVRSDLRAMMLASLHGAGVEIVSPQFINQRRLSEAERVLPPDSVAPRASHPAKVPVEKIFDKADKAEELEQLRAERDKIDAEIKLLQQQAKEVDESDRPRIEARIAEAKARRDAVDEVLNAAPADDDQRE